MTNVSFPETLTQLQDHCFKSAVLVVNSITNQLSEMGVNVDVVLEEISKARLSVFPPDTISTLQEKGKEDTSSNSHPLHKDTVPMVVELDASNVEIEPGIYSIGNDGVLQAETDILRSESLVELVPSSNKSSITQAHSTDITGN